MTGKGQALELRSYKVSLKMPEFGNYNESLKMLDKEVAMRFTWLHIPKHTCSRTISSEIGDSPSSVSKRASVLWRAAPVSTLLGQLKPDSRATALTD